MVGGSSFSLPQIAARCGISFLFWWFSHAQACNTGFLLRGQGGLFFRFLLAKALPKWGFPRLFLLAVLTHWGYKKDCSWGVSKCCLCVARHDILAWIHFQRLFAYFHWRCCTAANSFSLTLLSCSSYHLISLSQKLFLLLVFQYFLHL